MISILKFLDGKKTIIVGVLTTTVAFLVLKGLLDTDTAVFIDTLSTIIFGGAAIQTTSLRSKNLL